MIKYEKIELKERRTYIAFRLSVWYFILEIYYWAKRGKLKLIFGFDNWEDRRKSRRT